MNSKPARRKNNSRHNTSNSQSHHQIYVASDYETDTYIPTTTEKRTPGQINFTVMGRYVPNLEAIVATAPSAQLYTFSHETEQWMKADTEGALFVCQLKPSLLTGHREHCMVVLNRKGMENLIIEMREIENVEPAKEFLYITLRSLGELKTFGLFLYDDQSGAKQDTLEYIMKLWEQAKRQREAEVANGESIGLSAENVREMHKRYAGGEGGMGRRLSMTELFGQQR